MDDIATGFRLGQRGFFPWGTRFDALVPGPMERGPAFHELPCPEACGFATLYAELQAPRRDRPVMIVAYELAGTDMPAKDILARLVIAFGAPDRIERDELSPYATSSSHVVLYAAWRAAGGRHLGLSIYGAPRASPFGDGIGKLYVGWGDDAAAATPWRAAWTAANAALAATAQSPGDLTMFSVSYDVCTAAGHGSAERCLATPESLDTPEPIARRLGPRGFALWSDAARGRWYLSTRDVTVRLGEAETSPIRVANIAPARGGGYASIDAGSWWVRCAWNSRTIEDAARALERIAGLVVERHTGHDA